MDKNCIFCKLINGEIPANKIYEDNIAFVMLDNMGDFEGHALVLPKQHYVNMLDCPTDVLKHLIAVAQKVGKHFVENHGFKGVNILNNNNPAAEQSVMHLHIHVVPRKEHNGSIYREIPCSEMDFAALAEKYKLN